MNDPVMMLADRPLAAQFALWLIGTFVGIEMIFKGWSYTAFGLSLRSLPGSAHAGL